MTASSWKFPNDRKTAVYTSVRIINRQDWIHYVTHDSEDGAWQFHPYCGPTPEVEASIVSLETIIELDETVENLADLPMGWHAWRDNPESDWHRAPK